MLTVAEQTVRQLAASTARKSSPIYLVWRHCRDLRHLQAALLLKGEGDATENIVGGPEYSTLFNDALPARKFGLMHSNRPQKRRKSDMKRMNGKRDIRNSRFVIERRRRS